MSVPVSKPQVLPAAALFLWELEGRHVVPQEVLRRLQQRRNGPGLVYLAAHFAVIGISAWLLYLALGTAWALPAAFLLGSTSVFLFAPLHECWHWTAFRARWLNDVVGVVCGAIIARPFFWFRYLHTAHHTYTQLEGRDTELVRVPKSFSAYIYYISGIGFWLRSAASYWRGITGRWNDFDKGFLPESEYLLASMEIRMQVLFWLTLGAVSAYYGSSAFLWFWVIPRLVGEPTMRVFRMAEHAGAQLTPNLLSSTRTTYTNPVIRFLYWQMPFHAEHHLCPSVPFHALHEVNRFTAPHITCVGQGYLRVHLDIMAQAWANGRSRKKVLGETA
ncbi:MAG: fatty acid desaturase, partial [Proteobacteria bacterium]|nr:fatty acid desaturase [Pseudomonadota bacterium]MDA1331830.1 fatty acid desaturase [Pseudomonadota bacterium]